MLVLTPTQTDGQDDPGTALDMKTPVLAYHSEWEVVPHISEAHEQTNRSYHEQSRWQASMWDDVLSKWI